jgi:molecular chaperone DnaK
MGFAIGIDLGTTNSVAALATERGIQVAEDPAGHRIHPSVVAFPAEGGVLVGHEAAQRRAHDPANTISSAKRLIGQNIRAPLVELALTALPFEVEEGHNQQPIVVARGRRMTVPEISALVLGHLRRLAERQFGDEINQAVITVPANFSDAQRRATREAGVIAGLEVLRLVNEPTAAALSYGYAKRLNENVAVFDYGGGTFDVSILKIHNDIFEVLGTGGDFFLGGDDIDRAIAEHLARQAFEQLGADPRPHPLAMTRLQLAAEQVKRYLSANEVAEGNIGGLIIGDGQEPLSLSFRITRRTFNHLIAGYLDRTIDVCRQVLTATGLEPEDVSDVICVGGSTRIPAVRERVAELFGREPALRIDPDEVVAHGAAVQAAILVGHTHVMESSALLLDVTPATLGIATVGGFVETLLEQNAPIPIERTKTFTTAHDFQERVVLECCRGERRRFDENEPLGTLTLDHLPRARRGETKIEVTFRVDTDGILHVRARDQRSGAEQKISLNVIAAPSEPVEPVDPGSHDAPAIEP